MTKEQLARLESLRDDVRHNSSVIENFQEWGGVFEEFDALIAEFRGAPETTVNLDDVMWAEVRKAIVESPRFVEMYAAGGMLNDGIASTVAWLNESPQKATMKECASNAS